MADPIWLNCEHCGKLVPAEEFMRMGVPPACRLCANMAAISGACFLAAMLILAGYILWG